MRCDAKKWDGFEMRVWENTEKEKIFWHNDLLLENYIFPYIPWISENNIHCDICSLAPHSNVLMVITDLWAYQNWICVRKQSSITFISYSMIRKRCCVELGMKKHERNSAYIITSQLPLIKDLSSDGFHWFARVGMKRKFN